MNYKQGYTRVEVVIRKEETAQQTTDGATAEERTTNTESSGSNGGFSRLRGTSAKQRFIRVNISHTVGLLREFANSYFSYSIHKQGLQAGDTTLADTMNRKMEIFQDVGGTASHIAMGALYGSSGGVPGMILGATTASLSSAISLTFKYANRQLEYDFKMYKENTNVQYMKSRANINLTTGRLR